MLCAHRYANPSAQAIASQAEEEGLEVEGFGAARLKAAQAKLAAAGGLTLSKDIKQDNILNLPLPDFEIEGELARPLGAPLSPNCRLPACMQGPSAELFHVGISIFCMSFFARPMQVPHEEQVLRVRLD